MSNNINKERNDLIILQQKFEDGKITEDNLTEKQKKELEKLYDEQIEQLNCSIRNKRKKLNKKTMEVNEYFRKIINKKNTSSKK